MHGNLNVKIINSVVFDYILPIFISHLVSIKLILELLQTQGYSK